MIFCPYFIDGETGMRQTTELAHVQRASKVGGLGTESTFPGSKPSLLATVLTKTQSYWKPKSDWFQLFLALICITQNSLVFH